MRNTRSLLGQKYGNSLDRLDKGLHRKKSSAKSAVSSTSTAAIPPATATPTAASSSPKWNKENSSDDHQKLFMTNSSATTADKKSFMSDDERDDDDDNDHSDSSSSSSEDSDLEAMRNENGEIDEVDDDSDSEDENGRIVEEGDVWYYFQNKPTFDEETDQNPSHSVHLSETDKAKVIKIVDDAKLSCEIGMKGYHMIRATHSISVGSFYFEVTINKVDNVYPKASYAQPHVRIGWSMSQGQLETPVGFDKYSFGYRDVNGDVLHMSKGTSYGQPFTQGDVIGAYIHIPERTEPRPDPVEKRESYTDDNGNNFCLVTYDIAEEIANGSYIAFYKNGKSQGSAFTNLVRSRYFPAISLYMGASVTCNFGPNFKYAPSTTCEPISHLSNTPSQSSSKVSSSNAKPRSTVTSKTFVNAAKESLKEAVKRGHTPKKNRVEQVQNLKSNAKVPSRKAAPKKQDVPSKDMPMDQGNQTIIKKKRSTDRPLTDELSPPRKKLKRETLPKIPKSKKSNAVSEHQLVPTDQPMVGEVTKSVIPDVVQRKNETNQPVNNQPIVQEKAIKNAGGSGDIVSGIVESDKDIKSKVEKVSQSDKVNTAKYAKESTKARVPTKSHAPPVKKAIQQLNLRAAPTREVKVLEEIPEQPQVKPETQTVIPTSSVVESVDDTTVSTAPTHFDGQLNAQNNQVNIRANTTRPPQIVEDAATKAESLPPSYDMPQHSAKPSREAAASNILQPVPQQVQLFSEPTHSYEHRRQHEASYHQNVPSRSAPTTSMFSTSPSPNATQQYSYQSTQQESSISTREVIFHAQISQPTVQENRADVDVRNVVDSRNLQNQQQSASIHLSQSNYPKPTIAPVSQHDPISRAAQHVPSQYSQPSKNRDWERPPIQPKEQTYHQQNPMVPPSQHTGSVYTQSAHTNYSPQQQGFAPSSYTTSQNDPLNSMNASQIARRLSSDHPPPIYSTVPSNINTGVPSSSMLGQLSTQSPLTPSPRFPLPRFEPERRLSDPHSSPFPSNPSSGNLFPPAPTNPSNSLFPPLSNSNSLPSVNSFDRRSSLPPISMLGSLPPLSSLTSTLPGSNNQSWNANSGDPNNSDNTNTNNQQQQYRQYNPQ